MKHLTIAFLAVAALASFGCKKKGGGGGDMVGKMTELKDAMCKCADKACADKVQADMATWTASNARTVGDKANEKPDEKMVAEMTKVSEEYGKCMTKAMTGGAAMGDTAKPAEPAAGGCAAGAVTSAEGGFCLSLPATQKAQDPYDKDESSRRYDYASEDGKGVTVVVTKMKEATEWDDEVKSLSDESTKATNKDAQASDLPGGGKFWSWVEADGKTQVTVLVRKDLKRIFCRTSGNPADPALVDACKSLRAL